MNLFRETIKRIIQEFNDYSSETLFKIWYVLRTYVIGERSEEVSDFRIEVNTNEKKELARRVAAVSIYDVIKMVPLYISSPQIAISILRRQGYSEEDYQVIAQTIIFIRAHDPKGRLTEESKGHIYAEYCIRMKKQGKNCMKKADFGRLIEATLYHTIDQLHVDYSLGYMDRDLNGDPQKMITADPKDSLSVLANELNLGMGERYELSADCIDEDVTLDEIMRKFKGGQFSTIDEAGRERTIREIEKAILRKSPLEVAKTLYVSKVTKYYESGQQKITQNTRKPTNVPIEVSRSAGRP